VAAPWIGRCDTRHECPNLGNIVFRFVVRM
jgi:hypothetical protein